MKAPLAAVTMVYNEPKLLPLWVRHYGQQVGLACCYVIDHGSDDGCTDFLSQNRIVIPRSPQDDAQRAAAISKICAGLLEWYESVVYCDVDEFLVADPAKFTSLAALASARNESILTATGFDVLHCYESEPALDFELPVSFQRKTLRFSAAMCKPAIIRTPVDWSPGFHTVKGCVPCPDDALSLFHLRYADLTDGLNRLSRSRTQPWCNDEAGLHQRMSDPEWTAMLKSMLGLPYEQVTLLEDDASSAAWRDRIHNEGKHHAGKLYPIDLSLSGDHLWLLPERFVGTF